MSLWTLIQPIATWFDDLLSAVTSILAEQKKQTALLESILAQVTPGVSSLEVTLGTPVEQKEK